MPVKRHLALIVQEHTSQEIADKLFSSLRTVKDHRFSLLQKLDVKNSIGLVPVAIQLGLLSCAKLKSILFDTPCDTWRTNANLTLQTSHSTNKI